MKTEEFTWEDIYKKYASEMQRLCYRYIPDPQEVQDVVHEGFLTAMEKHHQYQGRGSFKSWLSTIIINKALHKLKEAGRFTTHEPNEITEEVQLSAETDRFFVEEAAFTEQELLLMIHQLPGTYASVFNLYVLDGYKHKEISKMLKISVGTSKSYLARARKKLIQLIIKKAKKRQQSTHAAGLIMLGTTNIDTLFKRTLNPESLSITQSNEVGKLSEKSVKVVQSNYRSQVYLKLLTFSTMAFLLGAIIFHTPATRPSTESPFQNVTRDTTFIKVRDTIYVYSNQPVQQKAPKIIVRKQIIQRDTIFYKPKLHLQNDK